MHGYKHARISAILIDKEITVDAWGLGIFVVSLIFWFASKRRPFFLFSAGVGAGIVVGAIWAMSIVRHILGGF